MMHNPPWQPWWWTAGVLSFNAVGRGRSVRYSSGHSVIRYKKWRQPQGVIDGLIIAGTSCLVARQGVWQTVHVSNDTTLGNGVPAKDCSNCLQSGWSQSPSSSFMTSQFGFLLFIQPPFCLSVCLSPKCKKMRFSQILSNLELRSLLTTYRKSYMGFSKNPLLAPKIQDGGDSPSWILMPKCKNAIFSKTKQFRAMVSIDDLQEVVHGLFIEPIIGSLKSRMTEIRHLENQHDVIFFCRGWSDLYKISETGAE